MTLLLLGILSSLVMVYLSTSKEAHGKPHYHSLKTRAAPESVPSGPYLSCLSANEFALTVTSVALLILGLELTVWSFWLLYCRRRRH